ncbi:LGFP repeat-containing protein [Mycobacterium sp.]|uniref:LGFP repeat-containing protein n=1 Tax=Mycobacterium sp. TaxID=1785 RepID=UPI003D6BB424
MHFSRDSRGFVAAVATAATLATACSGAGGTIENAGPVTTARIATAAGMVLLQGEILAKYQSVDGVNGPLGLPIGTEQPVPNGGRRTIFENGAIYWSPQTGAHIVRDAIRGTWEDEYGGAGGPLGYPTTDEKSVPGGWQSQFQHGAITYTGDQPHVEIHT